MSDPIKPDPLDAEARGNLEPVPESRTDDYAEQPENAGSAQAAQPPTFEMVATAYNLHGQRPCHVFDFDHGSGYHARRLVETRVFASIKRARDALVKAGVPPAVVPDDSVLAAVADKSTLVTGMYDVPCGWSRGCDVGLIYRYGNTAYASSGPIAIFADGIVPESKQSADTSKLLAALAEDRSPATFILTAAHCASLLVHLLDCRPIVVVVSSVPILEAKRLTTLAKFAFGTTLTTMHTRRKDSGDVLIQFVSEKSRKQAFAQARALLETDTKGTRHNNKTERTHAPVTLILTTETDSPGNLASPIPPPGCIEIHIDAASPDAANKPARTSPDTTASCDARAVETYIEAVVREQDAVSRNADTNLPNFVERYLAIAKSLQNEDAVSAAVDSFAVLRYALTCGHKFGIVPWSKKAADEVMDACVNQWADHRRQREMAFERQVVDAVKKLLHPGSPNHRAKFNDREVRFKTINGNELMLIDSGSFDTLVVGHLDKARVLDALRKRKLLVTNGDGAQYQVRVDGKQTRFYAIDAAVLRAL
ncbi:hypothetical protein CY652_06915 [Burkholderia sp. WAC0059]|uniref:hypothetical protein n=1 Tax=Burkholderia sp. WAC0059 TaxID=2066022 RepID=UPI000C7F3405|nr:hypothetical protein [Burkholderia sp. WAC0059]PLZ03038.1 hypothetical protein CY652_06915 [Burkholderia sp. WAC0059]